MTQGNRKITPVTYLKVIPIQRKENFCLCKSLKPMFVTVRLFGLFPVTWVHENNHCTYRKSFFWMIYTFVICCIYIFIFASAVDFNKLANSKCLIVILNDITNIIYGFYGIVLIIVAYIRFPKWITSLNQLSNTLRDGLYCLSANRISIRSQYAYLTLFMVILVVQAGLLVSLNMSTHYKISFDTIDFTYRMLKDVSYGFQLHFTAFVVMMSGTLACFEKLTRNSLQYSSLHITKSVDESNSTNDFLGIVNYSLCKGSHEPPTKLKNSSPTAIVEYLRILHEDISLCIYMFNESMNPQFLMHTVVELIVLIIHWYAVVAYLVYTFKDPAAKAIHVLNCFYVLVHSSGLFLFLKNAQLLKNLVS